MFNAIRYLVSETQPERLGNCTAEVAFVGRSNVGKSTLLNALCGKEVARVSSQPGCTRTINVFVAEKDRWLVDLPGYGYAKVSREARKSWGPMIENYLMGRPTLRMVFSLIDAKVGPTELDFDMHRWLTSKAIPYRIVATKIDQIKPSVFLRHREAVAKTLGVPSDKIAWVSADRRTGIDPLRTELRDILANG